MKPNPRRRFGQHFLTGEVWLERIVAAIHPVPGDRFVEIGPGRGALTLPLLEAGASVHALEIDRDLAAALEPAARHGGRLTVHCGDALRADLAGLCSGEPYRLAGNLPYNISTPLLFHVLAQHPQPVDGHFMLQREVVERIVAGPGSRTYSRLSVMCQNLCRATALFHIPPEAFDPRPKVESTLVRLVPREEPLAGPGLAAALDQVVRSAFAKRRKTVRNSLGGLLGESAIRSAGVDPGQRAEQLGVRDFIALARRLRQSRE